MDSFSAQYWHLAWMAVAVFLIAYLGSPRHRNTRAFSRVRRLLRQSLEKRRYSQFHGIRLPTGGGGDELDHLLVSRFGVFVIVSDFRSGEISGGEFQELWKEKKFGRIRRWPNPLHRAKLHAETLRDKLDIPDKRIFPLVVIDGQDRLPSKLPQQVLSVEKLLPYLRGRTQQLFTPEQADRLAQAISNLQLAEPGGYSKTSVVRALLGLAVAAGVYLVFGKDIGRVIDNFGEEVEQMASPEHFRDDGTRKSEQEIFEESLICAFSQDTNRCSCYQEGDEKVNIELEKCRALAERGSILKQ